MIKSFKEFLKEDKDKNPLVNSSFEDEFRMPAAFNIRKDFEEGYKTPFELIKYVRTRLKYNSLLSSDSFKVLHKEDPEKRPIEFIENFYDKRNTGLLVYVDLQQIISVSGDRYTTDESYMSFMPSTWRARREFLEDVYGGDGKRFINDIVYFLDEEFPLKRRAAIDLEQTGVSPDTADTFGELMDEL